MATNPLMTPRQVCSRSSQGHHKSHDQKHHKVRKPQKMMPAEVGIRRESIGNPRNHGSRCSNHRKAIGKASETGETVDPDACSDKNPRERIYILLITPSPSLSKQKRAGCFTPRCRSHSHPCSVAPVDDIRAVSHLRHLVFLPRQTRLIRSSQYIYALPRAFIFNLTGHILVPGINALPRAFP